MGSRSGDDWANKYIHHHQDGLREDWCWVGQVMAACLQSPPWTERMTLYHWSLLTGLPGPYDQFLCNETKGGRKCFSRSFLYGDKEQKKESEASTKAFLLQRKLWTLKNCMEYSLPSLAEARGELPAFSREFYLHEVIYHCLPHRWCLNCEPCPGFGFRTPTSWGNMLHNYTAAPLLWMLRRITVHHLWNMSIAP